MPICTFWGKTKNFQITKVHSFCKQCLHKDLVFINWQLMSALASLERFDEEDLVFINLRSCRYCLQNEWPLSMYYFHFLVVYGLDRYLSNPISYGNYMHFILGLFFIIVPLIMTLGIGSRQYIICVLFFWRTQIQYWLFIWLVGSLYWSTLFYLVKMWITFHACVLCTIHVHNNFLGEKIS